jgi:hypothetical protein
MPQKKRAKAMRKQATDMRESAKTMRESVATSKKRKREDSSQTAARIVRESTQNK